MRFIAEREALGRGLYAGLVGICSPGRADLAVALRCALVSGNDARLFVGAGVVSGSTAESEWGETELKARALLGALGAQP
jgi:isochorismate synthase EntC